MSKRHSAKYKIDRAMGENLWAAPFATALRNNGGQVVASGRVPVDALLESLEAGES